MKQTVTRRRIPWAVVGVLLLLAVCIAPTLADEMPQLPHAFYGAVSIQGQPAPVGTVITATVTNGEGSVITEVAGIYGGMSVFEVEERLLVHKIQDSLIPEGSPISFFVNGAPAEVNDPESADGPMESYPFRSGGVTTLNIRGTGAPITHTITASAGTGGSITPGASVSVPDGSDKTFTIVASSGYTISQVTVDGSPLGAVSSYTFYDVTADHTIQATFTLVPVGAHTITASAGTGGTITPSGSVSVPDGADKTFTIAASSGYTISQVTVDGFAMGPISSYTFQDVTADHTIQATFSIVPVGTHTITASAGTGGTITPSGSIAVPDGSDKTFTIAASSGYTISQVTVDGFTMGPISSYTFQDVTADHTIQATFSIVPVGAHTITASAGTGGTITPSGSIAVPDGSDKTFTIAASSGYTISQVTVDGSPLGAVSSYTFYDVTADHTIQATFSIVPVVTHTITASAGTGGSINPSGSVSVNDGADKTFTIVAGSGYTISQVTVDGSDMGPISSYTFQDVTADHTIQATFTPGGLIFFTQTLDSGWNLFSIPITLDPGHGSLEEVFDQSLDMIDIVYGWDNQQEVWYIPPGSTMMHPLDAYYVKVTSTAVAVVYPSISVTEPPSRDLPSGLSLIGSAPAYEMGGFAPMPVDQALISIKEAPGNLTGYTIAISPNLNQPGWVYALGGPLQDILSYKGYWVIMENPDTYWGFSTTPI